MDQINPLLPSMQTFPIIKKSLNDQKLIAFFSLETKDIHGFPSKPSKLIQNQFLIIENLKMRQSLFISDKKSSKLFCMNTSFRCSPLFMVHSVNSMSSVIILMSNWYPFCDEFRVSHFELHTFLTFHNFEMQMLDARHHGNVKSEKFTRNQKEKFPLLITLFNND